jgi:hypothetical protein
MIENEIQKVADRIVELLEEKKALRTKLPFHLDRDKFLFLLATDVRKVICDHFENEKGKAR